MRYLVAAALLCAAFPASAETWSCSLIEDGQPQITKYIENADILSVEDWRTRLAKQFRVDSLYRLKIVQNGDQVLVAVADIIPSEAGTPNVYARIVVLDKRLGDLTDTVVIRAVFVF